mgnify:CR=1 FL=1
MLVLAKLLKFFLLVVFCLSFSSKSFAISPINSYFGVALSDYNDGNQQKYSAKNFSNAKILGGLRVLGLLSAEIEYSNFLISKNNNSFDVSNYGANLYLTPPILRVFGTGLEGIIGYGVNKNTYKHHDSGLKSSKNLSKFILGARLIMLEKIAVFATSEFMLNKPELSKSKTTPVIISVGVNYFLL